MSQSRRSSTTRAATGARSVGFGGLAQNLVFMLAFGFAVAVVLGLIH